MATGLVGVIAHDIGRYTSFWGDLADLARPDGVQVLPPACRGSIPDARNALVDRLLASDADWLVMIDDDHELPADFLLRQMARTQPIVASVYLSRNPPYLPTLYGPPLADGSFRQALIGDFPTAGIVPVYAAGASGMFVRRAVYERMPRPWYVLDRVGEDLRFCQRAHALDIPVHVDLESRLGHLAPFAIWPDVHAGEWVTSIRRDEIGLVISAAAVAEA